MRGKGLWAEIWGYLGINKDMTVEGAVFDHASETPGLGANITERFFMDDSTININRKPKQMKGKYYNFR